MGALDIRMASAGVQNLGSVARPVIESGAAEAFGATARSAEQTRSAIERSGHALARNLSERGEIVNKTLNQLGRMALEIADSENERMADNAVLQWQKDMQEHSYGDGKDNLGRFNENITDVNAWTQEMKDWNRDKVASIRETLSFAQRNKFDRKIADKQLAFNQAVARKAVETMVRGKQETSLAKSGKALEAAAWSLGSGSYEQQAIDDFITCKNEEFDAHFVPDAARPILMRKALVDMYATAIDQRIAEKMANPSADGTVAPDDPDGVAQSWDQFEKGFKDAGYAYNSEATRTYMPDGLTEPEKALFAGKIEKAKHAAITRAFGLRDEKWKLASEGARKKAEELLGASCPKSSGGILSYHQSLADEFRKISEDPNLKAEDREDYLEQSRQLLQKGEDLSSAVAQYEKDGTGGFWMEVRGKDGKTRTVFQPDRIGNGKKETDPGIAAKYTLVGRDGKTPYEDDPSRGMEELEYDLRMGNISVPFYNAQMGKMRVYSDTKAKEAFVRLFGASPELFEDRDVDAMRRKGIDTDEKTVYAKNRWWAGNHQTGGWVHKRDATWREDAYEKDGGEYKIEPEQQAKIYDIILSLTAEGMDPEKALEAYLAPTFRQWAQTDLADRLDPDRQIDGRTFREWLLNDGVRFNEGRTPGEREVRIRSRQKSAYGVVGEK